MKKEERDYMSKVASLGCIVCRRIHGEHDPGLVELHHPRAGVGMGRRASNFDVLPLCVFHHRGNLGVHGLGTKGFPKHWGFTEQDLLADVNKMLDKQ
jgi:hypothetical protein